jgi:hypothetical protein
MRFVDHRITVGNGNRLLLIVVGSQPPRGSGATTSAAPNSGDAGESHRTPRGPRVAAGRAYAAAGVLEAERHFRKVAGYRALPKAGGRAMRP